MRVTLEIPDQLGWILTDHAERKNTTLGGLIAGLVVNTWRRTPDGRAPSVRDRVEREWSRGAPDPVIAHRLGMQVEQVRLVRRALKLKAHKFRRELWEHELTPSSEPPASSGVLSSKEESN